MYKRYIQDDLSFKGQRLTQGRHKIHPYPAMLHPLLVDFLLDKYAKNDDIIFDPFCGSGVTLLQSNLKQYKSLGYDINPLALLIAKVKTDSYDIKKIRKEFADLKKALKHNAKVDIPKINNIEYWYLSDVIKYLGQIRYVLKNNNYKYKDFFIVIFAFICRHQSLTKKGEFKRHRIDKIKPPQLNLIENNVFIAFFSHIDKMINEFAKDEISLNSTQLLLANSETINNHKSLYDLVITSPPYGDSQTTVAYGQYCSFGAEWTSDLYSFGSVNYKVDKESLGKVNDIDENIYQHKDLVDVLKKIKNKDVKRSEEVKYFFNGYYKAIKNIVKHLKSEGRVCFVVGNRTVKGCQIPMDQITASFLEQLGLLFENIFIRNISNKVMPLKNSPSNNKGLTKQTMIHEYIVVFRK